jgi:hypothetical protein
MELFRDTKMEVQNRNKKENNRSNICTKDKDYVVANICQNSLRE